MRRIAVQRDPQTDLDLPALYSNLLNNEAEQLLALLEVQGVDRGLDLVCERTDPLTDPVLLGELLPLRDEGFALLPKGTAASLHLFRSALQFHELEQAGLIEVDEPAAFRFGGFGLAIQSSELGSKELIVRRLLAHRHRHFSCQEHVWIKQSGADLIEDECIELVRSDVAFRTASVLTSRLEWVVVAAVVVAVVGSVSPAHLVARHAHAAAPAFDQPPQEPMPRLGPPRAPLRVVSADSLRGLEQIFAHHRRHRDGDPLVAGAPHLAPAPPWPEIRHRLGPVVVDTSRVRFVAQDASDRGGTPDRLSSGRGNAVLV
ncbi:MAG: hypothetical protein V3V67_06240 [Myxococcota bacterium]